MTVPPEERAVDPREANLALLRRIDQRASKPDGVLGPCIRAYRTRLAKVKDPLDLLANLTGPLRDAWPETRALIERNMATRWRDQPARIPNSVTNSIRRSAGTNYQGLVSYALAHYLLATNSPWYLEHPVPKEFKEALAIVFAAGIPVGGAERDLAQSGDLDAEDDGEEKEATAYSVNPDVDILLRKANWKGDKNTAEPVLLLSVKTSLADRAGMAARWKIYFDLATNPCPYRDRPECAYGKLGLSMENANRYNILHGLVTANIYKIDFHDTRYRKGELASGQTRSNTYMFDLKLTTRDDAEAETPDDWKQFPFLVQVLKKFGS